MRKHNPYALATLSICISSIPIVAYSDDHAEIVDEVIVTSSYVRSTQIEKHSLVIDGDAINQGAIGGFEGLRRTDIGGDHIGLDQTMGIEPGCGEKTAR